MLEASRELRKKSTRAEQYLWRYLKNRQFCNIKFKRQFIIKPYIIDFICLEHRLIIEMDGSQHLDSEEYDKNRTIYLESLGFKVIRFWNHEVLQNTQIVLSVIYDELKRKNAI
jgi:very-short-patch-repair endonuclease